MPYGRFFLITGLQVIAVILAFRFLAPDAYAHEVAQPGKIVLWTVLFGLPISLFEYLYHRYLLHSSVLPFLGVMHDAHSEHHGLTSVKAPVRPNEPERMVPVKSEYPIEHEHQEESMMFPPFAISIFFAIFFPLLAWPMKAIFPSEPVLMGLTIAVTLCYSLYELWHAVLHLPFERFWEPWMKKPLIGPIVKHAYAFHLMHHWRPTANQAVVGFWGFAIWDHLFRTHRRPENMPLNGAEVNYGDAQLNKPLWPISQLDKSQATLYKWSRRVEKGFSRLFHRKATQ
jgi:hemolysin III